MTRLLTNLSAAMFCAAGLNPTASAAPTATPREKLNDVPTLLSPATQPAFRYPASFGVSDLVRTSLHSGFASIHLGNKLRRASTSHLPTLTEQTFHDERAEDANDFILPEWTRIDPDVTALSQAAAADGPLLSAAPITATSSDVEMLSVPEVPLPLNVIPAFAGIAMVLVIHHRSLKRRNMPK